MPKGVVSTGWPAVEDKCQELGIRFRWWQKPIGQIILAKRADGKYASTIGGTGLSIPRQVGKTFLVGAIIFALCLLRPNLTVVWSAHRLRTAEETFKKLQAFARRKRIAPHVLKVILGSGEECIEFRNGSRIMFGARAAGFGRGFDEVDVVVYDEAQILTDAALDDMIPATNQCRQETGALMLFMGTPPKPDDPSEVFTGMREDALSGEDEDTGWIEFGSDRPVAPKPAALTEDDWKQIAKANPSFPDDTQREAILRMRKKLTHDSFVREGQGIWDELRKNYAFGAGKWETCGLKDENGQPYDPGPHVDAIALAISLDRLSSSIGAAGVFGDRLMVAAVDRREGTGWLVPESWRIHQERGCPVVVARSAADMIPALEAVGFVAGESLIIARSGDAQDACAQIFDRVQQGTLAHAHHPHLDNSVHGAHRRTINGERWVWDRKNSETDVSMLEAVTLAQWQASLKEPAYDLMDSIG